MQLQDLQHNMLVETREGNCLRVIKTKADIFTGERDYVFVSREVYKEVARGSDYCSDLTHVDDTNFDIVKVYDDTVFNASDELPILIPTVYYKPLWVREERVQLTIASPLSLEQFTKYFIEALTWEDKAFKIQKILDTFKDNMCTFFTNCFSDTVMQMLVDVFQDEEEYIMAEYCDALNEDWVNNWTSDQINEQLEELHNKLIENLNKKQ